MAAANRIRGLQKLPKPGGFFSWYWSASQISRLSDGFMPRTVRLWHGRGEPAPVELVEIERKANELCADLQEWLLNPDRKVRGKRGQIYFVRAGANVKIGFSAQVSKRLAQLQTFFPFKLELLLALPGTVITERQLHHRFRSSRTTGEWFRYGAEIEAFIWGRTKRGDASEPPVRITVETSESQRWDSMG